MRYVIIESPDKGIRDTLRDNGDGTYTAVSLGYTITGYVTPAAGWRLRKARNSAADQFFIDAHQAIARRFRAKPEVADGH